MTYAYIVDAVRTPGGRRNGRLSGWHPADLAGEVLRANGQEPETSADRPSVLPMRLIVRESTGPAPRR